MYSSGARLSRDSRYPRDVHGGRDKVKKMDDNRSTQMLKYVETGKNENAYTWSVGAYLGCISEILLKRIYMHA